MKFCVFRYYKWIYLAGSALTLLASILLNNLLLAICLVLMYSILFFKSLNILYLYRKTSKKHQSIAKKIFDASYRVFRVRVALFWLAFSCLCALGKFVFEIGSHYFYWISFFFLFLDKFFVNVICLLQKFCDPKGTTVLCCCGCPCRGWDLLMIHTPLLFALSQYNPLQNVLIIISSFLALLSLIYWEIHKYHLVVIRPKCAKSCDLKLCREQQK